MDFITVPTPTEGVNSEIAITLALASGRPDGGVRNEPRPNLGAPLVLGILCGGKPRRRKIDRKWERGPLLIKIRCPWCSREHTHGWPEVGSISPSHCVAHCCTFDFNPGYYIRPALFGEPGFDQHVVDPSDNLARLAQPGRRPK